MSVTSFDGKMSSPFHRIPLEASEPILSPSKAARDASLARDWSYVSSWLSRKYHPHSVPRFERNEETLQALLALVAANVAADERAELLIRAQEEECEQWDNFEKQQDPGSDVTFVDEVVGRLEECFDDRASEALESIAQSSLELGTISTSPRELSHSIVSLTSQEHEVQALVQNVELLTHILTSETEALYARLSTLKSAEQDSTEMQETMQQEILEWNRASKLLNVKFEEYRDRVASLERAGNKVLTVAALRAKEDALLQQKEELRALQKGLATYQGLPPDIQAAREEYGRLNEEVVKLRRRRDEMFENMAQAR